MKYKSILWIVLTVSAISCDYFRAPQPKEAVARVGDKFLYKDDLRALLPAEYTREDSIAIISSYLNNWAAKELMLANAKRNLQEDKIVEFETLVDEYRTDLYTKAYKEGLVNQSIDTVVGQGDLETFYQGNKEIFRLNEDLLKLRYIQLKENHSGIQRIRDKFKRFNKKDQRELDSLSLQFRAFSLNDSVWVKAGEVFRKIPLLQEQSTQNNLKKSQFFELQDSLGVYLVHINDLLKRQEIAPIEYVKPTLRQIIINQRKLEFVRKLEKDIINDAITKNNLKSMNKLRKAGALLAIFCVGQLTIAQTDSLNVIERTGKDSIPKNPNFKKIKIDGVASVVGDYVILNSDIDKTFIDLQSQGQDIKNITRCQLLGKLMEDKLYAHHAVQDSILVSDGEVYGNVDRQIDYFLEQLGEI